MQAPCTHCSILTPLHTLDRYFFKHSADYFAEIIEDMQPVSYFENRTAFPWTDAYRYSLCTHPLCTHPLCTHPLCTHPLCTHHTCHTPTPTGTHSALTHSALTILAIHPLLQVHTLHSPYLPYIHCIPLLVVCLQSLPPITAVVCTLINHCYCLLYPYRKSAAFFILGPTHSSTFLHTHTNAYRALLVSVLCVLREWAPSVASAENDDVLDPYIALMMC
jgi:hypothetical protein